MTQTILLTGSQGFTGEYIAAELGKNGYNVVGLVQTNAIDNEIACDLGDKIALIDVVSQLRPDGVIHLAALSFVGHENEAELYAVNTVGTTNLLEALYQAKLKYKKIVIASSANVYGNPTVEMVTEDTHTAPVNHYAASKLAMEYMVKTYYSKLPIIITRPFNYTGIGQDAMFLIPKIVNHFRDKKKEIELGNMDVARDFSDVRDIARAYLMLYESEVQSEIVNLSSGKTYELKDIISLMADISGYEINIKVNPDFVRGNEIKKLIGNNKKLVELTGYSPAYSFEETLRYMYQSEPRY
jgi:nucleoside-diphosphate-sugar epimerase